VFVGSRVDFLFILGFLLSVSVDFWYWLALLFVVASGKFTSFFSFLSYQYLLVHVHKWVLVFFICLFVLVTVLWLYHYFFFKFEIFSPYLFFVKNRQSNKYVYGKDNYFIILNG
jgi:hypothetical protein